MKKYSVLPLLAILVSLSSCSIISGIAKVSFWSGAIMVIVVIGLIIFIISRLMGGGKS